MGELSKSIIAALLRSARTCFLIFFREDERRFHTFRFWLHFSVFVFVLFLCAYPLPPNPKSSFVRDERRFHTFRFWLHILYFMQISW